MRAAISELDLVFFILCTSFHGRLLVGAHGAPRRAHNSPLQPYSSSDLGLILREAERRLATDRRSPPAACLPVQGKEHVPGCRVCVTAGDPLAWLLVGLE